MSAKLIALRARAIRARPLAKYVPGFKVIARDPMGPASGMTVQYTYTLTARAGKDFAPGFRPVFTPQKMLRLGVFSGKYINDCTGEFPREWFEGALARDKLSPDQADPSVNLFGVRSRQGIGAWRRRGWIPAAAGDRDARGWFQWYCRYWLGRRMPDVDAVQIKRWAAFSRHAGQVEASYAKLRAARRPVPETRAQKLAHRPRQRQAMLQWSHNPFV
jgi:hypothetical protein